MNYTDMMSYESYRCDVLNGTKMVNRSGRNRFLVFSNDIDLVCAWTMTHTSGTAQFWLKVRRL